MYELQPSSARWRAPQDWLEVRPSPPPLSSPRPAACLSLTPPLDSLPVQIMAAMIQIHTHRDLIHGLIVAWEGDLTPPDARLAEIALKTFNNFWEVGPQLAPADWNPDVQIEEQTSGMGKEVMAFMDRALEEEGERTVLVIRSVACFAPTPFFPPLTLKYLHLI